MYKIVTYIPEPDLETVKTAMFEAGAGHFGLYERCSWQTLGVGQFCPLEGANPTIGKIGQVSQVLPIVGLAPSKGQIQQLVKSGRSVRFLNGKWK